MQDIKLSNQVYTLREYREKTALKAKWKAPKENNMSFHSGIEKETKQELTLKPYMIDRVIWRGYRKRDDLCA